MRGLNVVLFERSDAAVAVAHQRIDAHIRRLMEGAVEVAAALARVTVATDLSVLTRADLVLDCTADVLDTKVQIFQALAGRLSPQTLCAVHTPLLSLTRMTQALNAQVRGAPPQLLGLHLHPDRQPSGAWLDPVGSPPRRGIWEITSLSETDPESLARITGFAEQTGALVMHNHGFDCSLSEAMQACLREAGWYFLLQGISPYDVDRAMTDMGLPYGLFADMDRIGLVELTRRFTHLPQDLPRSHQMLLRLMVQSGRTGQRGMVGAGQGAARSEQQGFYLWSAAGQPRPDPDLYVLLNEDKPWHPSPSTQEMQRVVLAALANQAARLLRLGAVQVAADLDVLMVRALGWPVQTGGPLHMAETKLGLLRLHDLLRERQQDMPNLFTPDPLIVDLLRNGRKFSDLNAP
jgi:3-hydroxyacyl-CoA dehydrogenase